MVSQGYDQSPTSLSTWRVLLIAFTILLVVTVHWAAQPLDNTPAPFMRVFQSFMASGHAAVSGGDPFGVLPGTPPSGAFLGLYDINLNPPALLPVFAALAWVGQTRVAPWWLLVQFLASAASAVLLMRYAAEKIPTWLPLFLVLAPQVVGGLYVGEDYAVLGAMASIGWVLLLRGEHQLAAIAIGLLVAAKPNFGLWPVFLLLAGYWRVAFLSIFVAGLACLLPILLFHVTVYEQWITAVAADTHWRGAGNATVQGYFARAGAPLLGKALASCCILHGAFTVRRCRPSLAATSALALVIGILASPLAWAYYVIFLYPALVDGFWGRMRPVCVGLLLVGFLLPLTRSDILQSTAYFATFLLIYASVLRKIHYCIKGADL